jgi:hypothetical protein
MAQILLALLLPCYIVALERWKQNQQQQQRLEEAQVTKQRQVIQKGACSGRRSAR